MAAFVEIAQALPSCTVHVIGVSGLCQTCGEYRPGRVYVPSETVEPPKIEDPGHRSIPPWAKR